MSEDVKHFLNSVRRQQADVLTLQEEYRRLDFEAHNLKGMCFNEKVQTDSQSDLSQIIERLDVYKRRVEKAYCRYIEIKNAADDLISNEKDGLGRAILRKRYLQNARWKDISEDLNYSIQYIWRLHGQALLDLEPYFKGKFRNLG